jgi:hypothetical protein
MRASITFLIVAAAVAFGAARAGNIKAHDDDIVWPTYTLVSKSYDTRLTCPRLKAEIDHVNSDIRMLVKARDMAENAWRRAEDTQSAMGRDQGGFLNTGTAKVAFTYVRARDEIKESQRVAELRRDHLVELLPSCKAP